MGRILALVCCTLFMFSFFQALAAGPVSIGMRALVVSATGTDPSYQGITTFLEFLGVPYDKLLANQQKLTPAVLVAADGNPKYQAIFLASDSLGFLDTASNTWVSAFDADEWTALRSYEATFKIRQVTYYTYPNSDYGLSVPTAISTETTPYMVSLTVAGQKVFPYLKPDAKIPIRYAYTWLADTTDPGTISLVQDNIGHDIVSMRSYSDGRQNLAVTCDNWTHLLHSQLLSYGIINWALRGVHLGERSVYLMPQVDDIFLPNDLYDAKINDINELKTYRISSKDMKVVEAWQEKIRKMTNPSFEDFTLVMVYNGEGATVNGKLDPKDDLVQYFRSYELYQWTFQAKEKRYQWVSHTFAHPDLNVATNSAAVISDLDLNHQTALQLRLTNYAKQNLVTGDVSGLFNEYAMKGIKDFGIKALVSNTSQPQQNNPSPNIGIFNLLEPTVLEVPRFPTNIYVPASTPVEEAGLYNKFYSAQFNRTFTYADIVAIESDHILSYMVTYNMDPLMFHQSNLRAYDGSHFLLADAIEAAIKKYSSYMNLPVLSPTMDQVAARMAQRMAVAEAGVAADWVPGWGITLTSKKNCVVALSGIRYGLPAANDTFKAGTYRLHGNQYTSFVQITAGLPTFVPFTGGSLPGTSSLY